jgi:hypothetical protein
VNILGTIASQFSSKPFGSFDSIATITVGSGGAANVEFTSIPATYTHLQVRAILRCERSGSATTSIIGRLNNATSGYAWHSLNGDGATADAGSAASQGSFVSANVPMASALANSFGAFVMDILDYKDTNKYKTVRALNGADLNGSGIVNFRSALFQSTNAITSIKFEEVNGPSNIPQYSSFALYGIKGA